VSREAATSTHSMSNNYTTGDTAMSSPQNLFCVYLTCYSGNKLPQFYIGSTSIKKILNGYRGSVSSKTYKEIWKKELKENPNLFKTKIISYHSDRTSATIKENKLQILLGVVLSPLYINQSNAIPNGIYGQSMCGANNPMFGCKRVMSEESKIKNSLAKIGIKKSEKTKKKMRKPKPIGFSEKLKGNQNAKGSKSWLGRNHTQETRNKISEKIKELNKLKRQGLSQSETLIK